MAASNGARDGMNSVTDVGTTGEKVSIDRAVAWSSSSTSNVTVPAFAE